MSEEKLKTFAEALKADEGLQEQIKAEADPDFLEELRAYIKAVVEIMVAADAVKRKAFLEAVMADEGLMKQIRPAAAAGDVDAFVAIAKAAGFDL